jgi:hypothetical protein
MRCAEDLDAIGAAGVESSVPDTLEPPGNIGVSNTG